MPSTTPPACEDQYLSHSFEKISLVVPFGVTDPQLLGIDIGRQEMEDKKTDDDKPADPDTGGARWRRKRSVFYPIRCRGTA